MSGTLQAPGGQPTTIDVSGAWKAACDDGCVPAIVDGGEVGWLAPSFVPPNDAEVAVGFDLGLGVKTGPGTVPLEIGLPGTGASPLTFIDGVTVDRSFLTGDAASPWRVEILIDATAQDANGTDVTMSGSAALLFTCDPDAVEPSLRCGVEGNGPYDDIAASTISYGTSGLVTTCPAAVLEHFWRPEQLLTGDAASKTIRIGDAEPMTCNDDQGNSFCGATAEGIEADGCTWRIDVVRDRELFIHGKASGCERESVYCSDVLFPQTTPL
jgi:hypothetical protein